MGSGKSRFVRHASEALIRSERDRNGTMVLEAKFKRGSEYASREILSSLFGRLVSDLVSMRDGKGERGGDGNDDGNDEADAEYGRRATRAVREALDPAGLASLARFVPRIRKLIPEESDDKEGPHNTSLPPVVVAAGAGIAENDSNQDSNASHWRLVFLLSGLVGAVLGLGRRVIICLDDLQWCDSTTSRLISEILISVSQRQEAMTEGGGGGGKSNQLLFVGMNRDNEINNSHPFSNQLVPLKKCNNIDLAEIKLSSLSREDVVDMISHEFRLPGRLVRELAKEVHHKTSGHALFVVQLLNSLVQDSTISYSPLKRRYNWDVRRIAALRTNDGVASLIVSNLSLLKPRPLRCLRILSCLGMQSDLSLVRLL